MFCKRLFSFSRAFHIYKGQSALSHRVQGLTLACFYLKKKEDILKSNKKNFVAYKGGFQFSKNYESWFFYNWMVPRANFFPGFLSMVVLSYSILDLPVFLYSSQVFYCFYALTLFFLYQAWSECLPAFWNLNLQSESQKFQKFGISKIQIPEYLNFGNRIVGNSRIIKFRKILFMYNFFLFWKEGIPGKSEFWNFWKFRIQNIWI